MQYRAIKITISTTKVKLFTTVVHIKQRTTLASKFTGTNGYLMCTWPEVLHVEPHPGVFITSSLSYTNNHRQLTKCRAHHFSRYLLPKTRTVVLALSLWPSFPANSLWCKPRGVIQSIYGNTERWAMLCMYKTLRFSKYYELRNGWPVYNFLAIVWRSKLFRAWLFDRWTLQ